MIKIPHTIKLVTELDENHETSKRLLALDNPEVFLSDLFAQILISEKILDRLNEGNSFAKVVLDK